MSSSRSGSRPGRPAPPSAPPCRATFPGLADLRANATLTDTTKKKVVFGNNLALCITATDRGGGKKDSIGITLWDGGTLVLSSDWTGVDTAERTIHDGDIHVH